jgi:type I restriction enzyme S subunit
MSSTLNPKTIKVISKTIGAIAKEIKTGKTPPTKQTEYFNGVINWYTPGDFSSHTYLRSAKRTVSALAFKDKKAITYSKDTVLITCIGEIGKVGITQGVASANQQITGIKLHDEVNPIFFALWCKKNKGVFENAARNAIVPILNNQVLSTIEVKFPESLDDQIRIAHLLVKVEVLIAQRKQHLQQLDTLLKGVFLEMFGFRDGTYTQWTIERLALSSEVVSGVTKGKKYANEELIEVPYMRVANVQDGHFIFNEVKTIAVTQKEIDRYRLRQGDLLLTEGGDPDKLGRGFVWEEQVPNCIHQNHIFRVRINEHAEINPYYLSALVGSRYGKAYFLKSAKQTTGIASINSTQLKNFPTLIPPIALQNHFSAIAEKIEGIKTRYKESLTDLNSLYGTLSQQAFKGELDLSRVPLLDEAEHPMHDEWQPRADPLPKMITPPEIINQLAQDAQLNGRSEFLARWLTQYLTSTSPDARQGSARLLESAWQTLQDNKLETEGETPALTLNDYDALKDLVFKKLKSGELSQTFDEDNNRVALQKRSADWSA